MTRRYFLIDTVDEQAMVARGVSGSIADPEDVIEEVVPFVHLKPDRDEKSVVFYPLVRGDECVGTLKLCNFTGAAVFGRSEVRLVQPIADAVANLLHLYKVIDELTDQAEKNETLLAEATEALDKLQVGERLSYQFLTATSHLHELAGLLSGMSSDKVELAAILERVPMAGQERQSIWQALDRYDRHRKEAHRKLREIMDGRPARNPGKKKPGNIKDLVNDQLIVYESRFRTDEVRVRKSLRAADVELLVDASALKYVFRILLNNAIRAVNQGSARPKRIDIRATKGPRNLNLRIMDNGIGINPADQKRVFEAFFTTAQDGSGIGLYWAKRTVEEEHRGKLVLEKSYPGEGSSFLVVLALDQTSMPSTVQEENRAG